MAPKIEEIIDKDILVNNEDFRESWLEYHEDRLFDQIDEFFNKRCFYCEKKFPSSLKCFCHERFCQDGRTKRYKCKDCGFNFKKNKDLMNHRKRHKNPGGYFCFSCVAEFTSATARIQHRMIEHREFQCQICFIKYGSPTDYVNHIQSTHSTSKFDGPNVEYQQTEFHKSHQQEIDSDPLVFKAENFRESDGFHEISGVKEEIGDFADFDLLPNNDSAKDEEKPESSSKTSENKADLSKFVCSRCNKVFAWPQRLMHHIKEVHKMQSNDKDWPKNVSKLLENRYTCKVCNKNFHKPGSHWYSHKKYAHGPEGKDLFFCTICMRAFQDKATFKKHKVKCKYICGICGKKFILKIRLTFHIEDHKRGTLREFKCKHCDASYSTKHYLTEHTYVHEKKPYPCQYCEKSFMLNSKLTTHIQFRHVGKCLEDKTYNCHICTGAYKVESAFLNHMKRIHNIEIAVRPSGRNKCNYCKKIFFTKPQLDKHKIKAHKINGKLQSKCPDCEKCFDNARALHDHKRTAHRKACSMCNKTYIDNHGLSNHMKKMHSDGNFQGKFLCVKCGKDFMGSTAYRDHERSDCGKFPQYQCDMCEKKFSTQGSLKTHKLIHLDIKNFPCHYCDKSFRNLGHVKRHERVHTGERPYICSYCSKTFSHKETLNVHLTSHTGYKKYMCTGCGKRFTCIANLQAHRRSHAKTCGLVPNCTKIIKPME